LFILFYKRKQELKGGKKKVTEPRKTGDKKEKTKSHRTIGI
jgi:hypothetical protein